jgi:hypothetical protein
VSVAGTLLTEPIARDHARCDLGGNTLCSRKVESVVFSRQKISGML